MCTAVVRNWRRNGEVDDLIYRSLLSSKRKSLRTTGHNGSGGARSAPISKSGELFVWTPMAMEVQVDFVRETAKISDTSIVSPTRESRLLGGRGLMPRRPLRPA